MVASGIDEREEVVMGDRRHREDRVGQRDLLVLRRVASLAPTLAQDGSNVGVDDGVGHSLGHGSGIRHHDGSEADVNDGLAVGASLVDELEQSSRRVPWLVVVEEPVTRDEDVVFPVVWLGNDSTGELRGGEDE